MIGNERILASAGSGKTFALTDRIIRLLALGADPARIVALTFTRKASGEFLDRLVEKLAEASLSEEKAAALAARVGAAGRGPDYFRDLLAGVIGRLDRLPFGTLDGFLAGIVSRFPRELHLRGEVKVMDVSTEKAQGRRVLAEVFRRISSDRDLLPVLMDVFFREEVASAGRSVTSLLEQFVTRGRALYLECPDTRLWGQAAAIWPSGKSWPRPKYEKGEALDILGRELGTPPFDKRALVAWPRLIETLADLTPATPMTADIERVLKYWDEWCAGRGVFSYYKKYDVTPETSAAMVSILSPWLKQTLEARMRTTRVIHQFLEAYEHAWEEEVRSAGWIGFSDLAWLLQPVEEAGFIGASGVRGDDRLFIDYRLDARCDHWLLDEFQDTSRPQWNAIANLVSEALTDTSGTRSLFYVGDVKQAIYGWRKGDVRLFDEVAARYGSAIKLQTLEQSWRSSPSVLDAVNRVFGDLADHGTELPGDAIRRWTSGWRKHLPSPKTATLEGFAEWRELEKDDFRDELVALLKTRQPWARGLSCSILVRDNKSAQDWQDTLLSAGIHATTEATPLCCVDNPLGAALRSCFVLFAHPDDGFARGHLRMTPFERGWERLGYDLEAFAAEGLRATAREGFAATVDWLLSLLDPTQAGSSDPFTRGRASAFRQASARFAAMGRGTLDAFVAFVDEFRGSATADRAAVQVLTFHKAKGLEYDIVLLPIEAAKRLDSVDTGAMGPWPKGAGKGEWIMELPAEVICHTDERLEEALESSRAESCYEELCVHYVGMTRAARGLHIFTTKRSGKSDAIGFPALLEKTLGEEYACGNASWFEGCPILPVAAVSDRRIPTPGGPAAAGPPLQQQLKTVTPSSGQGWINAGLSALSDDHRGTEFGATVHSLYEAIEWLPAARSENDADPEAREQVAACLLEPAIAACFTRLAPEDVVWRERRFDALDGDTIISGVFDRVVLRGGPDNADGGILLLDFKTDRAKTADLRERHGPQIDLYRKALAKLLGRRPETIRAGIIHVPEKSLLWMA